MRNDDPSNADNVTALWYRCFPENSWVTEWSNEQVDLSRSQEEGSIVTQIQAPVEPVL
jgi:hypothetical protein